MLSTRPLAPLSTNQTAKDLPAFSFSSPDAIRQQKPTASESGAKPVFKFGQKENRALVSPISAKPASKVFQFDGFGAKETATVTNTVPAVTATFTNTAPANQSFTFAPSGADATVKSVNLSCFQMAPPVMVPVTNTAPAEPGFQVGGKLQEQLATPKKAEQPQTEARIAAALANITATTTPTPQQPLQQQSPAQTPRQQVR
jgi:hypothetical protein